MHTTIEHAVHEFTKNDRCDKCQAEAWMLAEKDGLDLLFCNHHGKKNVPQLTEQGFRIEMRTKE